MSDTTITIPASVLIDGRWRDATWTVERRVDTDTVQYTASVKGLPTSVAIFITDDDLRALRKMAGEDVEPVVTKNDVQAVLMAAYGLDAIERRVSALDARLGHVEGNLSLAVGLIKKLEGQLDGTKRQFQAGS